MDPLSITASVVGIGTAVAAVVKSLKDISDKLARSNLTLLLICSESSSVHAALGQIESIFRRYEQDLIQRFQQQTALSSAFDTSLTGCAMLYSCLEEQVQDIQKTMRKDGSLDWSSKFKVAWRQDDMERLVGQIRGQGAALNLLLQGLQTESIFEVQQMLRNQGHTLTKVQNTTRSLRHQYPHSEVPESILRSTKTAESIFGQGSTSASAAEFAFDDIVINSKAYRRAMALAEAQIRGKAQLNTEQIQGAEDGSQGEGDADSGLNSSTSNPSLQEHTETTSASVPSSTPTTSSLDPSRISQLGGSALDPKTEQTPVPKHTWKEPPPFDISQANDRRSHNGFTDWIGIFGLRKEDIIGISRAAIEMQNIFWEIFSTEYNFIRTARNYAELYRSQVSSAIVSTAPSFIILESAFNQLSEMSTLHEEIIYRPLWKVWDREGAFASFDPEPFLRLISEGEEACKKCFRDFPLTRSVILLEMRHNAKYAAMLTTLRDHRVSQRLSWDSWLKSPLTRLQRYGLLIKTLGKTAQRIVDYNETEKAYRPLMAALKKWDAALEEGVVTAQNTVTWMQVDPDCLSKFRLSASVPNVLARAQLPCRLPTYEKWTYLQIVLADSIVYFARQKISEAATQRPNRLSWRSSERALEKPMSDKELLERTPLQSLEIVGSTTLGYGLCKMGIEDAVKLGTFSHGRGELPSGTVLYPLSLVEGDKTYSIGFFGDGRTGPKIRDNFFREDWHMLIAPMLEK